jgi:phage shock protein A
MATVKQIQYRLGQARKKLAKFNKEAAGASGNVKKLEAQLKKARAAAKKKPKKKKAAKKRPKKKVLRKKAAKKKKGRTSGSGMRKLCV